MGFSFAITPDFQREGCKVEIDNYGTPEEQYRYSRKLEGGGFLSAGLAGKAWVEASLPKRADGSNVEGVELGEARELMVDLYMEACAFVEPDVSRDGHRVEMSKVIRADLVRDFHEVEALGYLLDGLAMVKQKGRSKVKRHADPSRARAETLTVGPKAWKSTLYDKHAETGGDAPEGQLRFEARIHHEQLTSVGARDAAGPLGSRGWTGGEQMSSGRVVRLLDLEEENCRQLRRWMFERVGFDREVVAVGRVQEKVFGPCDQIEYYETRSGNVRSRMVDRYGMTKRIQRELWAYITAGARGADIGMSRDVEYRYRALAEKLGITLQAENLLDESRFTLSLDYEAGTQVLRAA